MSLVHVDSVVRPTKPPNIPSPKSSHAPKPPVVFSNSTVNEEVKKQKTSANNNNKVLSSDSSIEPELKLMGFVGFDSLPYQFVKRCQQNGYYITYI